MLSPPPPLPHPLSPTRKLCSLCLLLGISLVSCFHLSPPQALFPKLLIGISLVPSFLVFYPKLRKSQTMCSLKGFPCIVAPFSSAMASVLVFLKLKTPSSVYRTIPATHLSMDSLHRGCCTPFQLGVIHHDEGCPSPGR